MSRILAALLGLGVMVQSAPAQDVADSSAAHDSLALTVQRGVVNPRLVSAVDTLVLARNDIDTLEVSRGVSRRTGRAALIGLGAGALLGAVIGFATYEECVACSALASALSSAPGRNVGKDSVWLMPPGFRSNRCGTGGSAWD